LDDGTGYKQLVPYLGFNGIHLSENAASGHYNSLQVSLRAQVKRDLTVQAAYTLSRSYDPTAGNSNGYDLNNLSNPYVGWQYDEGPSFFDRTHVAFVNFVYDLPIFRTSGSRALKTVAGGWQLSGIVTMQTGAPLNITTSGTTAGSVVPNSLNRPNFTGSVDYAKKVLPVPGGKPGETAFYWFTPAGFSAPAAGSWGNLPHNLVRGPGRQNWNLSLFKSFQISESRGSRIELRAETFNFWNHTQFRGDVQGGGIGTGFDVGSINSTTGVYTPNANGNFGKVTSAYDPRTLQLGVKVIF
jgi:hypothetical protein